MKHFPYSQVLGLTESLVYGLSYMTKKNCNHHDFYPANIYYSEGKFKVINPFEIQASGFCLTSQSSFFLINKKSKDSVFYHHNWLLPSLKKFLKMRLGKKRWEKLIFLQLEWYCLKLHVFNLPLNAMIHKVTILLIQVNLFSFSVITERLEKVSKVYTPAMAECISLMLEYEVEKRIDPLTLGQLIHWKVES